MPRWNSQHWPRDSNQTASGELGAVQFGYRRLGYLLAREGLAPNHKKLLRLYRG